MASVLGDTKKLRPGELVMILEELDFSFYPEEIEKAVKLYKKSYKKDYIGTLVTMAEVLRPDDTTKDAIDEMVCLVMHLGRKNLI